MIETIRRTLTDLKQGKYVESYIIIFLTLVIITLDIFNLSQQDWLNEVTLALLALLAYGQMENRRATEQIIRERQKTANALLLKKYPEAFEEDIERANELWIVGFTLERTVNTYLPKIRDKLRRQGKVRILVLKPDSEASRMAARRDYRPQRTEKIYNQKIHTTLDELCYLIKNEKSAKNLQIKTSEIMYPFGYYAVDPETPDGVIYMEQYSIKFENDIPKLVFHSYDGEWYQFFRQQLYTLWEDSVEWKCHDILEG